jgi:hypothetical protein
MFAACLRLRLAIADLVVAQRSSVAIIFRQASEVAW